MSSQFASTIIPWIIGGIVTLLAMSAMLTIRSWRESKRSPYFFLRRQAEQQMQTYSLTTVGLLSTLLFVGTYAWHTPSDTTIRMVNMVSAKSADVVTSNNTSQRVTANTPIIIATATPVSTLASEQEDNVVVLQGMSSAELRQAAAQNLGLNRTSDPRDGDLDVLVGGANPFDASVANLANDSNLPTITTQPTLPAEYNRITARRDPLSTTKIGSLNFSMEVDDYLNPISPSRLFKEGFYTIYATFEYEDMPAGLAWSWVWRLEDTVISGGNEIWDYNEAGLGYVFLRPEKGFAPGQYTVEVWVNGELMSQSNLFVTTDVASQ